MRLRLRQRNNDRQSNSNRPHGERRVKAALSHDGARPGTGTGRSFPSISTREKTVRALLRHLALQCAVPQTAGGEMWPGLSPLT